MIKFENYTDIFFWNFKRMDNVNYNFRIVEHLCCAKKTSQILIFNKPIIVIIISIIECILYDFLRRINQHTQEIIPGLDLNDTKTKVLDELSPILSHVKKHNYLQEKVGENLYDSLDQLRVLRNRIHIQNRSNQLDKDEHKIWTQKNLKLAGHCLERICKVLCINYPRPNKNSISFSNFPRPWL